MSSQYWQGALRSTRWPKISSRRSLKVADFFSGCGGLSLGAYLAAVATNRTMEVRLAVDNWMPAIEVYKNNFSSVSKRIECCDAQDVVKDAIPGLDVLLAGPPCQGHSSLNNSTRRNDPRNELYLSPVDFAVRNSPRLVIIENVPSVVHASQDVVNRAISQLTASGYGCAQITVDISNFGVPQKRKRHLLVAVLGITDLEVQAKLDPILVRRSPPKLIDFLEDLQDVVDSNSPMFATTKISVENKARIDFLFDNQFYDLPDALRPSCHRDKAHSYISMYGRMHPHIPAQTITSGFGSMGQGRFVHPTRRRMITAREAARIQGLPDYFSFEPVGGKSCLREMIANVVPPAISAAIISTFMQK
nr:DNA cytosine methyltransferase [Xanthomonas campestris]